MIAHLYSYLIKFKRQQATLMVLLFCCFMLVACGGGSGSDTDVPSVDIDPIRVNAGNNLSIDENQSANINGGSSGGSGAITYTWQADSSITITHADTSLASASLTAPAVTQLTDYTITLVASDNAGSQSSDSFVLSVNPVNAAPVAQVDSNQISGYSNRSYPVTSLIQLDGSNSSDEDPQTADSPISAFNWQQIAGPSLLAGIDTTQASIQLVSPIIDTTTQAIIRLTVTDQEQADSSTDITLNLLGQNETIPEVSVTRMRDVFSGEMIKLVGTPNSIAPDAAPFNASWQATSTSANQAQINDMNTFSTFAISPMVTTDTEITYTLDAQDSFSNVANSQTQAQVFAPVARTVNDTGVIMFATNDSVLANYQQEFAGQDAEYGADRQTASGQVIKIGDGEQGFDFTRLDNNGDVIDNPSFTFNCIRDNVTGLIWQVKDNVDNTNINYVDQSFTWFADEENGNFEGELNANSASCNVQNTNCNTQDYVNQINAQGMCGFFDWRLPTPQELQSIVHYGKTTPPVVDTEYFPFWGDNNSQPLWYWTSQPNADGVNNEVALAAWAFDMQTGNDAFLSKDTEQRVILVRAGR